MRIGAPSAVSASSEKCREGESVAGVSPVLVPRYNAATGQGIAEPNATTEQPSGGPQLRTNAEAKSIKKK